MMSEPKTSSPTTKDKNEIGLRRIREQIFLDCIFIFNGLYFVLLIESITHYMILFNILLIITFIILTGNSYTNRWTITYPFTILYLLQFIRYYYYTNHIIIKIISILCIIISILLCILFPAVELPPPNGPYHVGMIDVYMDLYHDDINNINLDDLINNKQQYEKKDIAAIPVRILYPTEPYNNNNRNNNNSSYNNHNNKQNQKNKDRIPFLNHSTSYEFCEENMKFGAPNILKPYSWILHTWRLMKHHYNVRYNVPLLSYLSTNNNNTNNIKLSSYPCIIYSHGLGGTAEVYSYQAMNIASHGYIVLLMTHVDGSAPIVQLYNGIKYRYDHTLRSLYNHMNPYPYVKERRQRTNHRVNEMLSVTIGLYEFNHNMHYHPTKMNHNNHHINVLFYNRIKLNEIIYMGHSYGGATALTAAYRAHSDFFNVLAVIAYDPMVDWIPDDARRSLFPNDRIHDLKEGVLSSNILFEGGTGRFRDDSDDNSDDALSNNGNITTTTTKLSSIHDNNMLILISDQWHNQMKDSDIWAGTHTLMKMYEMKRFGNAQNNSLSNVQIIPYCCHNEFSDTCMLTPLWLAQAIQLTGSNHPISTSIDISYRTIQFIQNVILLNNKKNHNDKEE